MLNFLKNEKVLCTLGGAAAIIIGNAVLKSKKTRQFAVSGLAKGMKLQNDAKEAFQNMKDEAQDLCCDAKIEAGLTEKTESEEEKAE
jgi:uncharacterized protein YbjQ (UPF0145 family)